MDFAIVSFVRNGVRVGIRTALLPTSIVLVILKPNLTANNVFRLLATHWSAYRNNFSLLCFPLISGATSALFHRGLCFIDYCFFISVPVAAVFAIPLGSTGMIHAGMLGAVTGLAAEALISVTLDI
jgi:hypothetical protein